MIMLPALPCHDWPHLDVPHPATHSLPRQPLTRYTEPGACHATPALPCLNSPRNAPTHRTCRAGPHRNSPCLSGTRLPCRAL